MDIHLTLVRDRIHLRCGWRPSIAEECKSIPGWSFSKTIKAWTYPLSMVTLRQMREVFGDELVVAPELWNWAKAERKRERRLKVFASVHDAGLRRVPQISPHLSKAMGSRTYQRSGARFGAEAGSFLLADEPGLGKTATAMAALMEADAWFADHLIVAPKTSLQPTWGRQLREWGGPSQVFVAPEGEIKREKMLKEFFSQPRPSDVARFLVVNPAMVGRQYGHYCRVCKIWEEDVKNKRKETVRTRNGKVTRQIVWPTAHHMEDHKNFGKVKRMVKTEAWPDIIAHNWESVIVDESHEQFAAYTPSNVTQPTQGLLDIQSNRRILLTGTPLRGQERRIWGSLNYIDPKKFKAYWPFVNSFFEVDQGYFGAAIVGLDPDKREAFYALMDRYVLRRTRAEVRPDLPMGQRLDVVVQMSAKHESQYNEFERLGETQLVNGLLAGQGLLSEMTRLKQMAYGMWQSVGGKLHPVGDSPKAEWLIDSFLRERGVTGAKTSDFLPEDGGYKYVIASQSTEVLDDLSRRLTKKKIKHLTITGDVPNKVRLSAQETFQSKDKEYRVLLLQTKTGGVSLDLDAWCDEMVIVDETFVADDQVQLEGRTNNRSGRIAARTWWYLRTADTIDQRIAEMNYAQHDMEHKLLDGRRGVELALHLIRGEAA